MRLTTRHRQQRVKSPRIAISQDEITADLIYPAHHRPAPAGMSGAARRKRR
jgi:hypothetical protein